LTKLEFIGSQPTGSGCGTYHNNGQRTYIAKSIWGMALVNVHKVEIWVERLKRFIGEQKFGQGRCNHQRKKQKNTGETVPAVCRSRKLMVKQFLQTAEAENWR
jgi:hypothetical protein